MGESRAVPSPCLRRSRSCRRPPVPPGPVDRAWITALPKAEVHLHLEGCVGRDVLARAADRHERRGPPGPDRRTGPDHRPAPTARVPRLVVPSHRPTRRAVDHRLRHRHAGHRLGNPAHRRHRQPHPLAPLGRAGRTHGGGAGRRLPGGRGRRSRHRQPLHQPQPPPEPGRGDRARGLDGRGGASTGRRPVDRRGRVAAAPTTSASARPSRRRPTGASIAAPTPASRAGLEGSARPSASSPPSGSTTGCAPSRTRASSPNWSSGPSPSTSVPPRTSSSAWPPTWPTHPVEALRRAGVRFSLNTDDPAVYGIDVAEEYQTVRRRLRLDEGGRGGHRPHLDRLLLRPAGPPGRRSWPSSRPSALPEHLRAPAAGRGGKLGVHTVRLDVTCVAGDGVCARTGGAVQGVAPSRGERRVVPLSGRAGVGTAGARRGRARPLAPRRPARLPDGVAPASPRRVAVGRQRCADRPHRA